MYIQPIQKINDKTSAFLSRNGNFFIQEDWIKIYSSDKFQLNGIYNKSDQLIGVFTLYFEKKLGLKWIKNPPYSQNIGLVFDNPGNSKPKINTFNKSIYKLVSNYLSSLKAGLITISLPSDHIDMQPFIWEKFKVTPNYTYRLNLKNLSEEDLLKAISSKKRSEIKKATKDQLECKMVQQYDHVLEMVSKTFDRKNKSLDADLVSTILNQFSNDNNSFAMVTYQSGQPIAASFVVYFEKTAYYLLGGYDPKNRHNGAGALALFEAIKETRKRGIETFDFEGSMLPEVEKYFRDFGGDIIPYFTINKGLLPVEMILKFNSRQIF